jgi:sulfatase maturation enzyme AslB (radical SAM superfamily)
MVSFSILSINGEVGFLVGDAKKYFAYFPLRKTIVELTDVAYQILQNGDNSKYAEIKAEIYNFVARNDLALIEDIPKVDLQNNVLGLALSESCNLKCSYCHAEAGANKSIDKEIIDYAIDTAIKKCTETKQQFYLVFLGSGEPTVNWNKLKYCVLKVKTLCDSNNIPFHISMATNGVFGDAKRVFILENFRRITLSLDGPPEIHDKNRIRLNGKGSFENAFETAKFFYERKFPIRLRSTISSTDVGKMLYIYEYFQNHFPKLIFRLNH